MIFRPLKLLRTRFLTIAFLSFGLTSVVYSQEIPTDPAVISAGESLFKNNCATCHRVQEKLVGPALKNVYDRREIPWIISFVRNSPKMIADGDPIANEIYNEYNQVVMTSFDFSDDEILSVLAYVKDQTDNPPVAAVAETGEVAGAAEQGISKTYLYLIAGGLILIFLLMLSVNTV